MTEKTKAKANLQYLRLIAEDMDDSGSAALGEAIREIEEARMEVEELRKDAERYRWLRRQPNDCSAPRIDICHWQCNRDDSANEGEGLRFETADKTIDAAMAAKEGEQ